MIVVLELFACSAESLSEEENTKHQQLTRYQPKFAQLLAQVWEGKCHFSIAILASIKQFKRKFTKYICFNLQNLDSHASLASAGLASLASAKIVQRQFNNYIFFNLQNLNLLSLRVKCQCLENALVACVMALALQN